MNETDFNAAGLRAGLIDGIRAARAAERDVLGALEPGVRDAPAADGGWSPKDVQAHLTAWKGRTVERLRALRVGLSEPIEVETDEANAIFHAERFGLDVGRGPRRRRRDDRGAGRRDRGRDRRDPRPPPDQRHDHGQRLGAHAHPPGADRGRRPASSRGPSNSPTRSPRSSTAAVGRHVPPPTRATTSPASTR